jgi:undecaprenyl-diphosphatase
MHLWKVILIAVVQGLTEFLPVSSSGHMVLAKDILGLRSPGAQLEVALHWGTLAAVLLVFWRDVAKVIAAFCRGLLRWGRGGSFARLWSEEPHWRMAWLILLGSVPTACVGLLFRREIEAAFSSGLLAALMLFVTGEVLWLTRSHSIFPPKGKLRATDALWVGISQAFALLPGISRSGATISTGLFRGVDRAEAARFSFLLSAPAVFGAGVIELPVGITSAREFTLLLIGATVAAGVGYLALLALLRVVQRGHLHWFAYYCWAAAILGAALSWAQAAG